MREKYIEEKTGGEWFLFGTSCNGVDISNSLGDVSTAPSECEAKKFCEAYNKLHREYVKMAQAFDAAHSSEFDRFWYGKKTDNK